MGKLDISQFDNDYINKLFAAGRYDDAADYYEQFEYKNSLQRDRALAKINECRAAARQNKAIYSHLDESTVSDCNFADNWWKPGAYNAARWKTDDKGNYIYKDDEDFAKKNPAWAKLNNYMAQLGSSIVTKTDYSPGNSWGTNYMGNKTDAASVKVTIPYKKEATTDILFGSDWLFKDNTNEVDDIYNYIYGVAGINKKDLENSGVIISTEQNGDVSFIYDKNSDYGTLLTVAIANATNKYSSTSNRARFKGYDADGNEIEYKPTMNYVVSPHETHQVPNDGTIPISRRLDKENLQNMLNIVSSAEKTKAATFNIKNEDLQKVFSSTSFNLPGLDSGENKKKLTEFVKSGAYETNKYRYYISTDADDQNPLENCTEKDYKTFMEQLAIRDDSQIHYQGMISGDEQGVLMTLDPYKDKDGKSKGTRMKLFIAGYCPEIVSYAVNSSSDLMAAREYTRMKGYGSSYEYKFKDGAKAFFDDRGVIHRIDKNGNVTLDNSDYAKQNLIRDLDRDFILSQADMQLSQYLNPDGTYNMKSVREVAKSIAFAAAEELYPNTKLQTTDGQNISLGDIFSDNKENLQNAYANSNEYVRLKLQEIQNIYNTIIGYTFNQ